MTIKRIKIKNLKNIGNIDIELKNLTIFSISDNKKEKKIRTIVLLLIKSIQAKDISILKSLNFENNTKIEIITEEFLSSERKFFEITYLLTKETRNSWFISDIKDFKEENLNFLIRKNANLFNQENNNFHFRKKMNKSEIKEKIEGIFTILFEDFIKEELNKQKLILLKNSFLKNFITNPESSLSFHFTDKMKLSKLLSMALQKNQKKKISIIIENSENLLSQKDIKGLINITKNNTKNKKQIVIFSDENMEEFISENEKKYVNIINLFKIEEKKVNQKIENNENVKTLLCEGYSDFQILKTFFHGRITPCGGTKIIELARNEYDVNKNVKILLDGDEQGKEYKEKLQKEVKIPASNIHLLKLGTIENYIELEEKKDLLEKNLWNNLILKNMIKKEKLQKMKSSYNEKMLEKNILKEIDLFLEELFVPENLSNISTKNSTIKKKKIKLANELKKILNNKITKNLLEKELEHFL